MNIVPVLVQPKLENNSVAKYLCANLCTLIFIQKDIQLF